MTRRCGANLPAGIDIAKHIPPVCLNPVRGVFCWKDRPPVQIFLLHAVKTVKPLQDLARGGQSDDASATEFTRTSLRRSSIESGMMMGWMSMAQWTPERVRKPKRQLTGSKRQLPRRFTWIRQSTWKPLPNQRRPVTEIALANTLPNAALPRTVFYICLHWIGGHAVPIHHRQFLRSGKHAPAMKPC